MTVLASAVLCSSGSCRNETLLDEIGRPRRPGDCNHFTGSWIRTIPLVGFCIFLVFMVTITGHRRRPDLRSHSNPFQRVDIESPFIDYEDTTERLSEISPLLKAEAWRREKARSKHTTPATLTKRLVCAICLDSINALDKIREGPCLHVFHGACLKRWWLTGRHDCPLCKQSMLAAPKMLRSSDFYSRSRRRE